MTLMRNCTVAKMFNPMILPAKRFDAEIVAKHGNPHQDYHGIDLKDNYFAFDGRDESGHPTDMILFDHWGDKQAARPKWTYLNHAIKSKANVELRRSMKNGRVDARFVATKRILKGKQIFLCYGKNPELHK